MYCYVPISCYQAEIDQHLQPNTLVVCEVLNTQVQRRTVDWVCLQLLLLILCDFNNTHSSCLGHWIYGFCARTEIVHTQKPLNTFELLFVIFCGASSSLLLIDWLSHLFCSANGITQSSTSFFKYSHEKTKWQFIVSLQKPVQVCRQRPPQPIPGLVYNLRSVRTETSSYLLQTTKTSPLHLTLNSNVHEHSPASSWYWR